MTDPMRTRVKICGITNREDAFMAADAGADALGFVFYPQSPRAVNPDQVKAIIATLPPFVTTVGLFVNEDPGVIRQTCHHCALDWIQLHGDECPEQCVYPGYRVIRGLRIRNAASVAALDNWKQFPLLLDAWSPDAYGGTGHPFDWALVRDEMLRRPAFLAGGLTPDNVGDAVRRLRPWGVDVSSGVELTPGRKDPAKVRSFIAAVTAADSRP